jgi:hypothetical protein
VDVGLALSAAGAKERRVDLPAVGDRGLHRQPALAPPEPEAKHDPLRVLLEGRALEVPDLAPSVRIRRKRQAADDLLRGAQTLIWISAVGGSCGEAAARRL